MSCSTELLNVLALCLFVMIIRYRSTRQKTTQKLKMSLMCHGVLAPVQVLIQRFEPHLICLSSTQYRLSHGVQFINSKSSNIKMKIFILSKFNLGKIERAVPCLLHL